MTNESMTQFLTKFVEALQRGDAAIFAGPGLSHRTGFVDWKMRLKSVADSLGLDIEKESDLLSLTQYYHNARLGARGGIKLLLEKFSQEAEVTPNHRILARLPVSTYWTTNYDLIIERALEEAGKRSDIKYEVKQLGPEVPHRDVVVYKMHGLYYHPDSAVITRDDYENYHIHRAPFLSVFEQHLLSKTVLGAPRGRRPWASRA